MQAITVELTHSRSLHKMQQVLQDNRASVNYIHTTTAITQLLNLPDIARTMQREERGHQLSSRQQQIITAYIQLLEALWGLVQMQMKEFGCGQLSNMIYAVFVKAPLAVKQQFEDRVMQQLLPAYMQQVPIAD